MTPMRKAIKLLTPIMLTVLVIAILHHYNSSIHNIIAFSAILLFLALRILGLTTDYLTALMFFVAIIILKIAPSNIVLSGFASEGFWIIFAGMIIGSAIKATGLAQRLSEKLNVFCIGSYVRIIIGIVVFGIVMSFIMPSAMGRIILLIPVLIDRKSVV